MVTLARAKRCVVCGTNHEARAVFTQKPVRLEQQGLCGFAWLEPEIETCTRCGHMAPELDAPVANPLDAAARAVFAGLTQHTETARRCLTIAASFGNADPRVEGRWVLEAAWANEREGRHEAAVPLRFRAAALFETALWMGRALVPVAGGSARLLAECFRVGGAPERAREHIARVVLGPIDATERKALLFELCLIEQRDARPYKWQDATRCIDPFTLDDRKALLLRTIDGLFMPDRPLAPIRAFIVNPLEVPKLEATYAIDYLEPLSMATLLERDRGAAVTAALAVRRDASRFGTVLEHADPVVRLRALHAFLNATFPNERHGRVEQMLAPLLARLSEPANAPMLREAPEIATVAAQLLKRALPQLDPRARAQIAEAAAAALRMAGKHPSLEGALERLLEATRA